MNKLAIVATAAIAVLGASSASAATYLDPWTVSPTGAISVVFGDNGLDVVGAEAIAGQSSSTHAFNATTGEFTDTFSFLLPTGIVGFTLSSIGFAATSSLQVSSFSFNGVDLAFTNSANAGGGTTVMGGGGPIPITAGAAQVLTIRGTGGPDAVFSGTATFEPFRGGAVPEPATWALMIVGFGGAGALLRRRALIAA